MLHLESAVNPGTLWHEHAAARDKDTARPDADLHQRSRVDAEFRFDARCCQAYAIDPLHGQHLSQISTTCQSHYLRSWEVPKSTNLGASVRCDDPRDHDGA